MNSPAQRRALVTGGSGDLGSAICARLAADGLHVIVHANANRARADEVVAAIQHEGGSAESVAFDVADGDATRAAIEACCRTARSRSWSTTPASTTTRRWPA